MRIPRPVRLCGFCRLFHDTLIEESIFFRNGWATSRDDPNTGASVFKHAVYSQSTSPGTRVVRCAIFDNGQDGAMLRAGGEMIESYIWHEPIGFTIGVARTGEPPENGGEVPGGVAGNALRNVITEAIDITTCAATWIRQSSRKYLTRGMEVGECGKKSKATYRRIPSRIVTRACWRTRSLNTVCNALTRAATARTVTSRRLNRRRRRRSCFATYVPASARR